MAVTSTQAVILAGTIVEVEDPDSPGTWVDIKEVVNIGSIGTQGSFVEATPIDITTKTRVYTSGLKDVAENQLTFNWIADSGQEQLRTWAQALRNVKMRVIISNGKTMQAEVGLSGFGTTDFADPNGIVQAQVSYRPREEWVIS